MATGSELRKQAEKSPRDELQQRLSAALPLIYALSRRETLTNELIALQAKISDLDNELGTHYLAALDGGWTVELLSSANLVLPHTATPERGEARRRDSAPESHAGPGAGPHSDV